MDRVGGATTCRCGYATPSTFARCLGCNRRLLACGRAPLPQPRPVAVLRPRPAPAPARALAAPTAVPVGGLAVAGLVAAAWIGPEEARVPVLTAAALLGAATSVAPRPVDPQADAPVAEVVPLHPQRLSDDELREAIAAW